MANHLLKEVGAGPWNVDEARNRLLEAFGPQPPNQLLKAVAVASRAHEGQLRADGLNYIIHPLRVARLASADSGLRAEQRLVAALIGVLHDTVEDTQVMEAELTVEFGESVARGVVALSTEPIMEGETIDRRRHRKVGKWRRLAGADYLTLVVHAADVCDNTVSWRNLEPGSPAAAKLPRWMMQVKEYQIPLLENRLPAYAEFLAEEMTYQESRGHMAGDWSSA